MTSFRYMVSYANLHLYFFFLFRNLSLPIWEKSKHHSRELFILNCDYSEIDKTWMSKSIKIKSFWPQKICDNDNPLKNWIKFDCKGFTTHFLYLFVLESEAFNIIMVLRCRKFMIYPPSKNWPVITSANWS